MKNNNTVKPLLTNTSKEKTIFLILASVMKINGQYRVQTKITDFFLNKDSMYS